MVNHCLLMLCIRSKRVYRGLFLSVDPFLRTIFYFFDLHGCILASAGSGDTLFLSQTRNQFLFGSHGLVFHSQTREQPFFLPTRIITRSRRVWRDVFSLSDPPEPCTRPFFFLISGRTVFFPDLEARHRARQRCFRTIILLNALFLADAGPSQDRRDFLWQGDRLSIMD